MFYSPKLCSIALFFHKMFEFVVSTVNEYSNTIFWKGYEQMANENVNMEINKTIYPPTVDIRRHLIKYLPHVVNVVFECP